MTGALKRWWHQIWSRWYQHPWLQHRWARRFQAIESQEVPWQALRKPLSACRVALVTTAGVHLQSDPPFDMLDPQGDASFRAIPLQTPLAALTITHDYYDHTDADQDMNIVFPLEVLRDLVAEGRLGEVAPWGYSFMGHIAGPHLETLQRHTAPQVAKAFVKAGVDVAIFTPA